MANKDTAKKVCEKCKKPKTINTNFYNTNSKFSQDGKTNICKACIKSMVDENNLETVYEVLQLMNLPFIADVWELSKSTNRETFGTYVKNINSLPQYRGYTWVNSVFEKKEIESNNGNPTTKKSNTNINSYNLNELEEKWGYGYTQEEYNLFEKKWHKLIDNYGEKTSLHTEGLITYIRFRVREEMATAKGDIKEAKDWGALASKAAEEAKLLVRQLSKSDISGGIELLPTLFEAVESEIGLISIMPKLLEQPYDDADMIIWCIVNYMRRLEDKPRVSYREVWNFYDEMLEEHCKQQGMSQEELDSYKRKRNNVFRDMEEIYKEPVYDGDN